MTLAEGLLMRHQRSTLFVGCCAISLVWFARLPLTETVISAQEFLPSPPSDRMLIYILDNDHKLMPLPFESGSTPLHSNTVAKETRTSYIEIKGEHATTILSPMQRWFLFTSQRAGTHPPFLVWLTPHKGSRRVTVVAQKGLSGFAIASEEIVKPSVRVLARLEGDEIFMEGRPRASLAPGEYAIIGGDLTRIATFRVAETTTP